MNYPVWEIYSAGGGLLVALIAVIHVYVAHFAVGGGLFLVLLEAKAYREKSDAILTFTRQHARFFLLLTMVFGSLTGVGIWFIIALLSPGTTSILIHTFVFGWAAEWVCFIGEIVALFVYYYTFGKMEKTAHMRIGLLYFLFAWLSLFIVNGVIGFMLTPGKWLETGNFWHGFFNPTFWPSLCFRTALAVSITGIFGMVTAVFIKDTAVQQKIVRFSATWLLLPLMLLGASAIWYVTSLPPEIQEMVLKHSPETITSIKWFTILSFILLVSSLIMMTRVPGPVRKPLAFIILLLGLIYMGSFEMVREAGRRPFLIYGHTYSNAIRKADYGTVNTNGLLKTAKWVKHKTLSKDNEPAAGKEIFKLQCLACHSVNGPMNDILPLTRKYTGFGMDAFLSGLGKSNSYMPPFAGTPDERQALARYIVEELNHHKPSGKKFSPTKKPLTIPEFNEEKAEYVLLAWNDLGIHFFLDCFPYFFLLPPGNNLHAQLIRRGEIPEVVTQDVEIQYKIEKDFDTPSAHIAFWDMSKALLGKNLSKDTGLTGNRLTGTMKLPEQDNVFRADMLPVVPYEAAGTFFPYPSVRVTAKDRKTGAVLAETTATLPVSTEMKCNSCHGGPFKKADAAGISDQTAMDILSAHDKNSHTTLLKQVNKGRPVQCRTCHYDQSVIPDGKQNRLNISTAIHGWHAQYLSDRGPEACHQCHPSDPKGATNAFRGRHAMSFDCTDCHGYMEDHALSLLKTAKQVNEKTVGRLMAHLNPKKVRDIDAVNPREPWRNLPDCLNCHTDFSLEDSDFIAFNKWTKAKQDLYKNRHDDLGALRCEACHGSPHAIYPAENNYGKARENIQPLQYNKNNNTIGAGNCKLCHIVDMEYSGHHENQL